MKTIYASLFCLLFTLGLYAQSPFYKLLPQSTLDMAREIIPLPSKNLLLVGYEGNDIVMMKTDPHGNLLDTHFIGEPNKKESASSVIRLQDGNLLINGTFSPTNNSSQPEIFKVDTSGNVIWAKKYAVGVNYFRRLLEQPDSSLHALSTQDGLSKLYHFDSNGNLLATQAIDSLLVNDMDKMPDSGFVLVGKKAAFPFLHFVVKLDKAGNPDWQTVLTGDYNLGALYKVASMQNGDMILLGDLNLMAPDAVPDLVATRLDHAGTQLWQKTIETSYIVPHLQISSGQDEFYITNNNIHYNFINFHQPPITIWGSFKSYLTSNGSMLCATQMADVTFNSLHKADDKGFYAFGQFHIDALNQKQIFLLLKTDSLCKSVTGLEAVAGNTASVKLSPNPARESLTLESTSASVSRFELIDLMGKTAAQWDFIPAPHQHVQLSDIPAGLYLSKIWTGSDKVQCAKLWIER